MFKKKIKAMVESRINFYSDVISQGICTWTTKDASERISVLEQILGKINSDWKWDLILKTEREIAGIGTPYDNIDRQKIASRLDELENLQQLGEELQGPVV
jgi:hypothetical protein